MTDPETDVPPMSHDEATDVVENDQVLQAAGTDADAPVDEDEEDDDDA